MRNGDPYHESNINAQDPLRFIDGSIQFWDIDRNEAIFRAKDFSPLLEGFELTPDGRFVLFKSEGQLANGGTLFVVPSALLDYYQGMITLNPHFPNVLQLNLEQDRFIIDQNQYNLQTGELLETIDPSQVSSEDCQAEDSRSLDGKLIFSRGIDSRQGQVCVLQAGTQELLHVIQVAPSVASYVVGVGDPTISPDGTQLLIPTQQGVVYVYQVE